MQLGDSRLMKVGIVGFGSIGFDVCKKIDQGIDNFSLAGITSRTEINVLNKLVHFKNKPPFLKLEDLCQKSDIIIDCAPKEAFKEILQNCMSKGSKLITVSGSGILENFELIQKANRYKTQVTLASGAIIGLDGLKAVSEGKIFSVKMVTIKPPNALINAKYVIQNNIQLLNLSKSN